ncbi:30S ribosomal protein S1 [bacterium BMS3Bbin06]|nr:30S ribosomal protein S1 [bacterium BMS3Abin08]GBE35411.1 30S ribosomal protein S1 [bacterium BMS3Bbin06]HDO35143.1 30S ribosomal protein S1 [Nitrospirota bacterium]
MDTHEKELADLYSDTIPAIEEGTVLKGKIIAIKDDTAVIDIGFKSEGFIPLYEFPKEEREDIHVGSEVEVYVSRLDSEGMIKVSIERARTIRVYRELQDAEKTGVPLEAVVQERIKGGYRVSIKGIKGFMPGSHADIKPLKNPDSHLGEKVLVKVLKLNPKMTNIVVSRREVLEEERKRLKEKTLTDLKAGALIKGVVKNITDYGVFIDLGGIDGLLHISDISWGRVRHPSDVFKPDQEVEVVVISFDPETDKVTLGYKQKRPDPWTNIDEKYPEGKVVNGKVVSLTDYGAFIEIEEGVEGLVHVSEIDWSSRPKHPSHYIEIGDYVDAKVLNVIPEQKRISLGIKQLKPKPWDVVARKYEPGQHVIGKVRSLTEFGAFIEIPEGVDALLHISDMSWTRHIKHPSELLRKGQKIETVVLSLEPDKERMALGFKQLASDPWEEEIPSRFHLGDDVKCCILRHTEYGIFVEIEGFVEGLIYSSEMDTSDKGTEEQLKEGDELIARIIKLDFEGRKIGLSLKNTNHEQEVEV